MQQPSSGNVADIIFGNVNPSGKLSLTYPRTTGDVGVTYYHKPTDFTYPLFPFGFGLSYTTFDYTDLVISPSKVTIGENVSVSVVVKNSGSVAGKEVVQLYLRDVYASITPEVKLLKGFHKVLLQPNESTQVDFVITPEDMSFIGRDNKRTIEPGQFNVTIGDQLGSFVLYAN